MSDTIELEQELADIVAKLDGLTLMQASKMVKHLEARWGGSAAAPPTGRHIGALAAAAPAASEPL